MTEEQIAQLLVEIAETMREYGEVTVDWHNEVRRKPSSGPMNEYEYTGHRTITITLDMPKTVH